jgi:high-affinity Fe2+/Pb2+ permease
MIGLWLSVLWLIVLFVGGIVASKTKSDLYKGVALGALIAIPATYVLIWLLS